MPPPARLATLGSPTTSGLFLARGGETNALGLSLPSAQGHHSHCMADGHDSSVESRSSPPRSSWKGRSGRDCRATIVPRQSLA
ncbi:MAG: hypothetical protein KatS3mg111_1576 [Pirellulaceae bacterium]|nr:MAG: hypothetical protein KatS3mg111_1484 [Pirellulaceae bacterium]GIW98243.1 MAG: hypothetical protein KatS3mg111_1576 [Pirellulaceae bacterium]